MIIKFRTMINASNDQGVPLPDEDRVTRFGKFLRSTSLDELPELINVLKEEMSIVGPRPLMMAYLDRIPQSKCAATMSNPASLAGRKSTGETTSRGTQSLLRTYGM